MEDMEKTFNFSKAYFNTMFKNYTGMTFHKYLQKIRLEKAKEFLEHGDEKITAICEMVGYSDAKQFFLLFKREVGLTPAEYRKKCRLAAENSSTAKK